MMTRSRIYLAILACLWGGYSFAAPMAEIMVIPKGAIEVRSGTSDWQKIDSPTPLTPGQEVRTDDASTAEIDFSDGSKMALAQNTQFAVEKADKKESLFNLSAGKIRTYFAGIFSSRFNIHTSNAVCSVRGTVFDMSAGGGKTDMSVTEGHLEVSDTKGGKAVVTSEESIHVGANGLEEPHLIALNDSRALPAARSSTVQAEIARDKARAMVEELRNRELKANEAQLGKDAVDAFGNRVRIEEYALRPTLNQFEFLFLSIRKTSFNYGHMLETFNGALPNDLSKIPAVAAGTFFSPTEPTNYLTNFEFFATNTIDAITESVIFGRPSPVNFAGFGGGVLYYPSAMIYSQVLSGPGVPGGSRVQFEQTVDYNIKGSGLFTWTQTIPTAGTQTGVVSGTPLLDEFQLNPANAADVAAGGCAQTGETCFDHSPAAINAFAPTNPGFQPQAQFNGFSIPANVFPSGKNKADLLTSTIYPDQSTVSTEKIFVSNDGNIFDFANPNANSFNQDGNYNLEIVVNSSLFQGRKIDVLIAPEILSQKHSTTTTPNALNP